MLVLGHDHGNMAVGSIVLSVVPIGKLIGTRKSEFAGTPPLSVVVSWTSRRQNWSPLAHDSDHGSIAKMIEISNFGCTGTICRIHIKRSKSEKNRDFLF